MLVLKAGEKMQNYSSMKVSEHFLEVKSMGLSKSSNCVPPLSVQMALWMLEKALERKVWVKDRKKEVDGKLKKTWIFLLNW